MTAPAAWSRALGRWGADLPESREAGASLLSPVSCLLAPGLLHLRQLVPLPPLPNHVRVLIRFGIADEALALGVEGQLAAHVPADVDQVADDGRAVGDLDVGVGLLAGAH